LGQVSSEESEGFVDLELRIPVDGAFSSGDRQLTNRPGIRRGELAFAIYEILHGGDVELPGDAIADVLLEETGSGLQRSGVGS
jgi:hypothetical protein